jgi:transcription elongation factor Elf1
MEKKDFVYLNTQLQDSEIDENEVGIVINVFEQDVEVNFIAKNITETLDKTHVTKFLPSETGDQFPNKVCNVCHKYLQTSLFDINQTGKGDRLVRRPTCKSCRRDIDGVKLLSSERKRMNAVKPHLEKFTCPICGKTTIPGFTSKIVIDHDHTNGRARAWICDSCNTGLGRFKDDIRLLEKAIEYLRSNSD